MDLPDPLTIAIFVGELLIAAYIILTVGRTLRCIETYSRNESASGNRTHFGIYRSASSAYSLAAIPLLVLALYLGIWGLEGAPAWNTNPEGIIVPGLYAIGAPFFLAITLVPPYLVTVGIANTYFLVSDRAIEQRKGRKIVTSIPWAEVTEIDASKGYRPRFLLIKSGKKGIRIDVREKGITNRNRLYDLILSKVQDDKRTPRSIELIESLRKGGIDSLSRPG